MTRNDGYYLDRIAEEWVKSLPGGARPGVVYRLDKLPNGYAGFQKTRSGTTHIDRYVYGHPKSIFRSINEFYPHFKHLMDEGGAQGCKCKACTGSARTSGFPTASVKRPGRPLKLGPNGSGSGSTGNDASSSGSVRSGSPTLQSRFFPPEPPADPKVTQPAAAVASRATAQSSSTLPGNNGSKSGATPRAAGPPFAHLPQGRPTPSPSPEPKRKQVDEDGTTDVYRTLLDKLKEAGPEGSIDEEVAENMSPDWRVGNSMLTGVLKDWRKLPAYVPRVGELVMFVRNLAENETLGWDANIQFWSIVDRKSKQWVDRPKWEAGVVTQMPIEPINAEDLTHIPSSKQQNVIYSGFRIEPLSDISNVQKPHTKQHRYVPFHALRPLAYWKDCLSGFKEQEWHPTVRHALTVASTFSLIGRYRFKGTWPEATLFCKGVYIGSELIMTGDMVRLLPYTYAKNQEVAADVVHVTAIKLRFVNLDEAGDDDYDERKPYNTCLHISGHAYTQDPTRSYDRTAKSQVDKRSVFMPPSLKGYGSWYHLTDPNKDNARLEVPYTRVIGRCHEHVSMKAWFNAPSDMPAPRGFHAVNADPRKQDRSRNPADMSRGLKGLLEARKHSQLHDPRIDVSAGKTWFWADTRIEQLDLHEVNDRFVGAKNSERAKDMSGWRKALRALDGKKGGLEAYHAARKAKLEAAKSAAHKPPSQGMMAASIEAQLQSELETGPEEDEGQNELDEQNERRNDEVMMPDDTRKRSSDEMEVDEEDEEDDALLDWKNPPKRPIQVQSTATAAAPPPAKKIETIALDDSDEEKYDGTMPLASWKTRK